MNLQENIHRIQSLLTENREEMMQNMIEKHGLYHSIKLMGGASPLYDNIFNVLGPEYFTNEDKIDFIRKVIFNVSKKYDSTALSIYDLGASPIRLGEPEPGENLQQIEHFNEGFVTIDVYGEDNFSVNIGAYTERYEDLSNETLNKVFIFMIDALDYTL